MISIVSTLGIIGVFVSGLKLMHGYARFNAKTAGRLNPSEESMR